MSVHQAKLVLKIQVKYDQTAVTRSCPFYFYFFPMHRQFFRWNQMLCSVYSGQFYALLSVEQDKYATMMYDLVEVFWTRANFWLLIWAIIYSANFVGQKHCSSLCIGKVVIEALPSINKWEFICPLLVKSWCFLRHLLRGISVQVSNSHYIWHYTNSSHEWRLLFICHWRPSFMV